MSSGLKTVDLDELKAALAPKSATGGREKLPKYPRVPHPALLTAGRIIYREQELRCVNSGHYKSDGSYVKGNGCGSPTHYKLDGIARCMVHILIALNIELSNNGD